MCPAGCCALKSYHYNNVASLSQKYTGVPMSNSRGSFSALSTLLRPCSVRGTSFFKNMIRTKKDVGLCRTTLLCYVLRVQRQGSVCAQAPSS